VGGVGGERERKKEKKTKREREKKREKRKVKRQKKPRINLFQDSRLHPTSNGQGR